VLLSSFLIATPAAAQLVIKANDDVNFKIGLLGQFQADTIHDTSTDTDTTNLFIRRFRLMFGGQVAKNVTFFAETDVPNLGKTLTAGKNIQPSMIIQDAYAEVKVRDEFMIDAGLMFVPFSHNFLQSAATLLPIDYSTYTYTQSGPTQSATGRDTGFQARGYLAQSHLEYRIGTFQGHRDTTSSNPLRYTGRVQYNVLAPENAFFYAGTYLGNKKVLSFGAAFDHQQDYQAYDADAFVDYPVGTGGVVTGQVDYNRFDGGTTFGTALSKQDDLLVEAGYLIRAAKLTPFLQWTRRDFVDLSTGDESRTAIGASYWWKAHNANIKGAYTHIAPSGAGAQHQFTVQLQIFYF